MGMAATVGFLAGTLPPLAYGTWVIIDELYVHPHGCGMGLLGGWVCILVAPIGGIVGVAIGCGWLAVYRARRNAKAPSRSFDEASN
jgi:hypothetical protein